MPTPPAPETGWETLESGRLGEARGQFWRELEGAEAAGDPGAFASAALGLGGVWVHEHRETLESARERGAAPGAGQRRSDQRWRIACAHGWRLRRPTQPETSRR